MADNETIRVGTFCWLELATTDLDSAKEFYGEVLGWQLVDEPMVGETGGTYTVITAADWNVGGMYQMHGPRAEGVPAHWATYLWVEDVDSAVEKTREAGGAVHVEPFDVPDVGRLATIQDPSGAFVSLIDPLKAEGMAKMGMEPGRVGWTELMTKDLESAKQFYAHVMGWTYEDVAMADGQDYTLIKLGDTTVGGMMAMVGPQFENVPTHWMPYINVEGCDATVARAQELGGAVIMPPMEVEGIGKFATLQDPAGAIISIIRPEPME